MIDSKIRLAGPEDEDELLELCRARHLDEGLLNYHGKPFNFSEERCRRILHRAIIPNRNSTDLAWCGVIGAPGEILQGSVYVSVQYFGESDEQYLSERWNWIRPEFRKSDHGKLLIAFADAIADELKMVVMRGDISPEDDTAKARFFRRNGSMPVGRMFVYGGQARI